MDKVLIKNGKVLLFKDNDVIIEKKRCLNRKWKNNRNRG